MIQHLHQLSESDLHQLAAALQSGRLSAPFSSSQLGRLVSRTLSEAVAGELHKLNDQGFNEAQVGTLLELVAEDRRQQAAHRAAIDLVTTGPEAPGIVNRDTSVVVHDLFANAEQSVLVAGYAVYQGQQVFKALADRMVQRPDLTVRMFLDIQRGPGDTSAPTELVRRFATRFRTQQWPADCPLPALFYDPRSIALEGGKRACLHAKCVVVDTDAVFVSSANFTEAAQERNIEMGLLVRSRQLGEQIVNHFNALLAANQLGQVL